MKYTKPIVTVAGTGAIEPKGSCIGHSCSSGEVFKCSKKGFSCSFGFSCSKYTINS